MNEMHTVIFWLFERTRTSLDDFVLNVKKVHTICIVLVLALVITGLLCPMCT